jgi:hypothetical protein
MYPMLVPGNLATLEKEEFFPGEGDRERGLLLLIKSATGIRLRPASVL